jgi:excisionase family DNA binding protein
MSAELLPASLPDRLLTDAELAELLAVPVSWVGESARAGQLPHIRLGRYRRFLLADVLAWLEENKTGGPSRRRRREPCRGG